MDNSRSPFWFSGVFVFLVLGRGDAQEPGPLQLATVEVDAARVFAMEAETQDATLPHRLAQGSVVLVRAKGSSFEGTGTHFYKVGLPGGVPSFVHAKLLQEVEDGWGEISASNVYLRSSASDQTIPIMKLSRGTRLRVLGREPGKDWWRVLADEETPVWMRATDLKILGPVEAHAAALEQARARTLAGWTAQVEERARRAALAEKRALALKGIEEVRKLFEAQIDREPQAIDLAQSRQALAAFKESWPAAALQEIGLAEHVGTLEASMDRLQLVQELFLAKKRTEEVLPDPDAPAQPETRPAPRVDWWKDAFVGHLKRMEEQPHYESRFALVKGGQVVAHLRCSTGRYALQDFQHYSVLVRGEVSTPPSLEGRKLVDVRRLEVLAPPF